VFQAIVHRLVSSDEVLAVIVATIFSTVGWGILRVVQGKSRIVWAVSHQHAFNLTNANPPGIAYTNEIWVQNVGRVMAEDVEVILAYRPQHFDVWPQRHFVDLANPDQSITIRFDNLNRREYVTISLIQGATQPPMVTNVRWRGGVGQQVPMARQQIFPLWVRSITLLLITLGFFSFWYFLIRFIFL
jgi:hypothetical protein